MNILKFFGVWVLSLLTAVLFPLLIVAGYNVSIEIEKSGN